MRLVSTVALLCMLGACGLRTEPELRRCPRWVDTYFSKPPKDRQELLTSHDLETQYEIFVCGTQYMHPSTLELLAPVASQGQSAARFLAQKLSARDITDRTFRDILLIFVEMSRQKTYDVASDDSLMRLLEARVQAIRDGERRAFANDLLKRVSSGDRP